MTAEAPPAAGGMRAALTLMAFVLLTVPLMPLQALLLRTSRRAARAFPHWYHRQVCRLLGIRLEIDGAVVRDQPVLLVANHSTWLDIPVLSAVAPVSFIAKKEVGGWPFVAQLARLQRSVFVDRTRRTAVGATTSEMSARLADGDTLVLFAEGTSSDGNRVLPLRTSLFGAVMPSAKGVAAGTGVLVQTCAVVYVRLHGMPLGRAGRSLVGWYGDMAMGRHAWALLKAGPLDVRIVVGPPVPLAGFADRKELARHVEAELRQAVVTLLRDRPIGESIVSTVPVPSAKPQAQAPVRASAKWT
jgi:lyso-ornithine lipid O-acyltransferase